MYSCIAARNSMRFGRVECSVAQSWEGINASLQRTCFAKTDSYMRLEVWNNDVNGFHDLLGTVETSMEDLLSLCKTGPVNYALQTKNTDPKAVVGPTTPLADCKRANKFASGTILRVFVRLPTRVGKAAAAAVTEASSPTAAHHSAKAREARQQGRARRNGTGGAVRRKKQSQAYPEDLAFLQALMKVGSPYSVAR